MKKIMIFLAVLSLVFCFYAYAEEITDGSTAQTGQSQTEQSQTEQSQTEQPKAEPSVTEQQQGGRRGFGGMPEGMEPPQGGMRPQRGQAGSFGEQTDSNTQTDKSSNQPVSGNGQTGNQSATQNPMNRGNRQQIQEGTADSDTQNGEIQRPGGFGGGMGGRGGMQGGFPFDMNEAEAVSQNQENQSFADKYFTPIVSLLALLAGFVFVILYKKNQY